MEYKRLTTKDEEGNWQVWEDDYSHPFEALQVAIERLAELEDKIEQGTLIELPCKVGDTLYIVGFVSNKYGIFRGVQSVKIDNISISNDGDFLTDIGEYTTDLRVIGKSIYLTREEAEKRLKELQE